jgi:uncharacterized protein involved in outer membrane biogenesis
MKRLAYALGALVVLAALVVLVAPAYIDTPAVRAEIQRRLAHAVDGEVTWEALEIGLFPAPHGELRRVRIEMPDRLSAAADDVKAYLRLWPLLRGRAEIASFSVLRPEVRIQASGESEQQELDAVAAYRKVVEPLVQALQRFAPDTQLRIEQAAVDPGGLRELNANVRTAADGVDLELSAASAWWKRLSIKGRVEYASLAARAQVELDALVVDKDLPPATIRAQLRTDAKTVVEGDFDASLAAVAAAKGKLLLPAGKTPELSARVDVADLAKALALARLKVAGLDAIESAEGRLSADVAVSLAAQWQAKIEITKSDAAVKLAQLPWKLSAHSGHVTVTPEQVHVAGARGLVGDSTFENAAARIELGKAPRLSAASGRATVKLEQWLPWLQTKLPLEQIASASGSVDVALKRLALRFDRPAEVDFEAVATPRKVSAKLTALPQPVNLAGGTIHADAKRVRASGLQGSIGDSTFEGVAAEINLGKAPALSAASGRATVKLEQWFPWLQAKVPVEDLTALSGTVEVDVKRVALRFDRPAEVDFDAVATPRNVRAALKLLPGSVSVTGGSLRAGPEKVNLDKLAVEMLDARAQVSGSLSVKNTALELALSGGELGEKAMRWALERSGVPPRFEPKTPLRFAARRIAWAPDEPLEVDARVDFDGGPALGVVLAWKPEALEVRRLTIKDARSDAVLGATVAGDRIDTSFSGRLHGQSIPAMLRQPLPAASGDARGELRVSIDRKRPERTTAEGSLHIEALDLSWLAGRRAVVQRADLSTEGDRLRITQARLDVEEQVFDLRGEIRRTDQAPVIEARVESAGVMLDRLLPAPDPSAPKKKSSALWPLPVAGRVEVAAGFIQYKDYKIEPFDGILSLEPKRARLDVKEARMCGVSFPMEVEIQPEDASAAAHITIKNQPLERTLHCLTGGNVQITGNVDLKAELRVQGRRPHLVRGLTGTVETEVRQGRVKKFALLGNILSFRGIASVSEMKEEGFPYRAITAKGHFANGEFLVDESFFDSDAVRLAAQGRVDLLGANSQLTVLVGLLTHVERIAGAIPIIGDVFGGSMIALPMEVRGDIRDPVIVPLGPRAVTNQLLGIFERTLKLPGKLVPAPEAK